nr:glycosyltransferase family 4 protein [Salinibacter ruber]
MLSPVHPCPPDRGSKIRIYQSVHRLLQCHEVQGLSFADPSSVSKNGGQPESPVCSAVQAVGRARSQVKATIWSLWSRIPYRSAKFQDPVFQTHLRKIVRTGEFDLVWVHFLNMLPFLQDSTLRRELGETTVILDQHNDMERFWAPNKGHGTYLKRMWAQWNIRQVRQLREKVLHLCDAILSVSEEDAKRTREAAPSDVPVWVVPNGVDLSQFAFGGLSKGGSQSDHILFVGSMDVEMNIDAVTWFAQEILPQIRERVSDATFDIVGRSPTSEVQALGRRDGVHVTGRVDDLQPYYDRASVAVVPSRLGGGTKLKVPEAMAAGVPVVATSTGAQGLDVEDGKHLLIANKAETFANAVVSLLKDPEHRLLLIKTARDLVETRYSWSGIYDDAIARVEALMSRVN